MNISPWSFGAEGCRPTFPMFDFCLPQGYIDWKEEGKKRAYIAAGVDGRRWVEESEIQTWGVDKCSRVLG